VSSPAEEYRDRLEARWITHEQLSRLDRRYSYARLTTFAIFVALLLLGWAGVASYWWLLLPTVVFLVFVQLHDRVIHDREAAARAMAFYERGLARIEDRWVGKGEPGNRSRERRAEKTGWPAGSRHRRRPSRSRIGSKALPS
jgi:hypothetical protein